MKLEVLDAIMGSGKSTGIIKWMNSNPCQRYMYISPMLSEVEDRIPLACESLGFVSPSTEEFRTKGDHLLHLLNEGVNVSFTHMLFSDLTKDHLEAIRRGKYVLVVDEEIDFIEPYQGHYRKDDIIALEESGHIRVEEDNLGKVVWTWKEMAEGDTVYSKLRQLCHMGMLYCSKRHRGLMVLHLPTELIEVTERTILLTYLFQGSLMEAFMKLKGVPIVDFDEVQLMKNDNDVIAEARELIEFVTTTSVKKVKGFSMSSSWYHNSAKHKELNAIALAIRSVYRYSDVDDFMVTVPKDMLEGKRSVNHMNVPLKDCYVYCACKATNDYAHKGTLVHAFNRYPHVAVKAYLQDYGQNVDDDATALSEMIQWIWRSKIRNSEPIKVCIMNNRMEKLLKNWLNV